MKDLGMKRARVALALVGVLTLSAEVSAQQPHEHEHGEAERLGTVDFPVSCSPDAQAKFGRAVALLHSFWYDEAEKAFRSVAEADPSCAMAHWGVAMSLFHPIWAAANPAAAPSPAEFERGREALGKAKAIGGRTGRERNYIAAVDAFYAIPGTGDYATRARAFEEAMERLHRHNGQDREAGIFHALALLGNAPPTDKTYAKQKQAAQILNGLLPEAPEHPGIAHYLIHSFDYPPLAQLALPAARAYSNIAASSPHALHMPSHIFTRLALWDDSIESNLSSAEMARRHVRKMQGPEVSSFDQLHALDYLEYAYLQQAADGAAKGVLDEVAGVSKLDAPNFAAAYALAAVPARHALERRQWRDAATLGVRPTSFPWSKFPYAEAITHFARALGGARSGDLRTAREATQRLEQIHKGLREAKDAFWASQVEIQMQAGAAWIAHAEGQRDEALRLMRSAAELEDATDKHPVTPGSVLPARELLGDLLLELGDGGGALREYEASLELTPGRFNSLAGASRAAERNGDRDKARDYFTKLEGLCAKADGSRPELVSLRTRFTPAP